MSALAVVVLAVLALLAPYAPLALDYGQRAAQTRRHVACLRRIAALELELGMRGGTLENFMQAYWMAGQQALPRAIERRPTPPKTYEKQWAANRRRLATIPHRNRRRGL